MRHVDGLATLFDGSIVCAHNAEFDWLFLSRAMRRAGVAVPGAAPLHAAPVPLARPRAAPVPPPRRPVPALRHPVDPPHDAAADAEATAVLLPRLLAETGITERAQLEPYRGHDDGVDPLRGPGSAQS